MKLRGHDKTAPLFKPIQDSEVTGGRTEWKDDGIVILTGWAAGSSVCRSAERSFGVTAHFVVIVSVTHSSWEDNSPGCSSRCSGSRSCHTAVAGNRTEQVLRFIEHLELERCCCESVHSCLPLLMLKSYLVPAAVSCVTGLRAHVGAHHRWRGRGDGDMRHSGRGLCGHRDSRAVISLAQLLWVLIPNNQIKTKGLLAETKSMVWRASWLGDAPLLHLPVLCLPLCATQLLQQFLVPLVHRKHTAEDRNTRR